MSGSARAALIFGAVFAVAGGVGYYFVKIYRPRQVLHAAQDEITGWEDRWKAARACLLGPTPGSSKTSEALAMREMSPDPWERGGCTALIAKLSRGDAPDSGLHEVEAAWSALDSAAGKAAQAFATHVAESTTLTNDPLPAALDALDAARMSLRAAASLPVDEGGGKALPAAQIIEIKDGADPVEQLDVDIPPSAHGFALYGNTASRLVQVTLQAGAAPKVQRVGAGSLRALPDTSWGASPNGPLAQFGALDAEGAMAAGKPLDKVGKKDEDRTTVAAVIGTADEGVVVYGSAEQLAIAHVHAGAAKTTLAKIELAGASSDVDGRAAVVWTGTDHKVHAQIVKPGGDEPEVELPGPANGYPCLTRDRAWISYGAEAAYAFGGGQPVASEKLDGLLIGCAPDGAIARTGGEPQQLVVCTPACRKAAVPSGAPEQAALTLVGGKIVAVAEHGGVIGVWSEDGGKTFYALPAVAHPVMAHEWPAMALTDGKVIDVLARGPKTFVIVRLPITAKS